MADQPQSESPEFDAGEGWRVLDPDGNVVASGGVSIAQMDGQLAEQLGIAPAEVGRQVVEQIQAYEQARTEGEQE